jgi:uncharacterized protein (TIGR03083 family)
MTTEIDVSAIERLSHGEAMERQAEELKRSISLLGSLGAEEWTSPTDCPAWDVHAMYQHVLGACEAGASMRQNIHQMRLARAYRKRHGGPLEAALSAVQVNERSHLDPTQIVQRLSSIAPKTVRGRARTPAPVRAYAKIAVDGPVHETWNLGYLIDTIYLRDLWMHRVDAARAVNRPLELTADHDGRIVADVVSDWARRHGKPFVLELTGPAGAVYASDLDNPECEQLSVDAIEFARTLSGRVSATGLLTTVVPF